MAIIADGISITIPTGANAEITVTPYSRGKFYSKLRGKGYILSFSVRGAEPIIEKSPEIQTKDRAIVFQLSPKDTDI